MVQRYPGAVFVHRRVSTLRGVVGIRCPYNGSVGGVGGVPGGEG
uniref:Uncharacterized protein n=1 Tax=Arundo donax TaxID=35708 RepID=A0A0A9FQU5_ARUDO